MRMGARNLTAQPRLTVKCEPWLVFQLLDFEK